MHFLVTRRLSIDKHGQHSILLLGPRGTGKTSWARETLPQALYLDLLDTGLYRDLVGRPERLASMIPKGHQDWIIIDEVQKVPELMNEVHRLIEHQKCRFLLTGSSARNLRKRGVNLLAGRALHYHMHPLTAGELQADFRGETAALYGLLPRAVFGHSPARYLETYVVTYLREEVLQEGLVRQLGIFSRFLEVASFSQGSPLNMTAIAREVGINRRTVESYFAIVQDLLIAATVPVFTKRAQRALVAAPKFYFFDVGVYRALRPKGPLDYAEEIDGAALETLLFQHLRAYNDYLGWGYNIYYWRTRGGVEVDFVLYGPGGLYAFEVKRKRQYQRSDLRGLQAFRQDYPMAQCFLVTGGDRVEEMDGVTIVPIFELLLTLEQRIG